MEWYLLGHLLLQAIPQHECLGQDASTSPFRGPLVAIEGGRGTRELIFYSEEGVPYKRMHIPEYEIHYESGGKVQKRFGDSRDAAEMRKKHKDRKWTQFTVAGVSKQGSVAAVARTSWEGMFPPNLSTFTVHGVFGEELWTISNAAVQAASHFHLSNTGARIALLECVSVGQRDCEQLKGVWGVVRAKDGKELLRMGPYSEWSSIRLTENGKYGYIRADAGYANGLPTNPTLTFFSVGSKKFFVCDPDIDRRGSAFVTEDGRAQIRSIPYKVVDGDVRKGFEKIGDEEVLWERKIDE